MSTDPSKAVAPVAGSAGPYGVLQLGAAQVALPLDALREVIPCPPRFGGLPAAAPGLLGAVSVRGKVVPVLDLRVALGLPAAAGTDGQVVALLRHGGALLGLLTDGVRGLTPVPAGALGAMSAGGGLLFSGSFERGDDGAVVSVLDVAAVMALPGVPLMRDAAPTEDAPAGERRAVERQALMLLRCGAIGLAMDVTEIHTTLPRLALHESSMAGPVCRGVIEHAGVRIPALDPLALMGLGRLVDPGACQALLLRLEAGLVALLVHQMIDIVRVPHSDCLALPALALRRPELFRGVLRLAGHGDHLWLGAGVLQREPDLIAFSTLNARTKGAAGEAAAPGAAGPQAGARRDAAVITYDIGAEVATRLAQVSEVLPVPVDCTRPAAAHPAVLGLFTHRGHAVTMVCLTSLLGGSPPEAPTDGRVLLVGEGDAQFGFVVPRLCHIENTVWEQPAERAADAAGAKHPLGRHAVVEIGQGAQRRTLHLIDLQALLRSLLRPVDAGAAPADAPAEAALAAG